MQTGIRGGDGKGPAPAAGFVEANGTTNGTTKAMNWSLVEVNGTSWLFVEANGTNWSFVGANGTNWSFAEANGTNWSLIQAMNWSLWEGGKPAPVAHLVEANSTTKAMNWSLSEGGKPA